MKVSVIGLGYIGLPTSALIASQGISVVGVDVNHDVVETINKGNIHIVEPKLELLVRSCVENGNLRATLLAEKSNVFIITVPTPLTSNNKPDLSFIESAIINIANTLEKGNLIILESTSPVGTSEKIVALLSELRPDLDFPHPGKHTASDIYMAYCPERVLPGNILFELVNNDRIIGGITKKCSKKALEFYQIFVESECLITDSKTAELSKLVENSFRDVNIAFANELSIITDKLNINVWDLINLSNRHPRVNILQPGPGVGGHCIAVDPWFIVDSAPEESKLINLARIINDQKPEFVLKKIHIAIKETKKNLSDLSIACLGLTFKANIDDLRESPALEIARKISKMSFKKQFIVEPNINELPVELKLPTVELIDLENALLLSDILLLLVDHSEFIEINLGLISGKQIVDTKGIWPI